MKVSRRLERPHGKMIMNRINQPQTLAPESLERLKVALLKFTLRAEESIELPSFAGSTFRGAFGAVFRRIACAPHCRDAKTCLLASACAYARIFEAVPDVEGYRPATDGGLPRPFIIHPPFPKLSTVRAGDAFSFHLALVGFASNYVPYFILTWRELGQVGIGRGRGRFRLETVESCLSLDDEKHTFADSETLLDHDTVADREPQTIYSSKDELVRNCLEPLTAERLLAASPGLQQSLGPEDTLHEPLRLTLELLTPMRLKSGGEFLRTALPFDVLIGALLRRLESLSYFYCGGSLHLSYQALIAKAKEVKIAFSNLRWVEWHRYSRRQDRKIPWGGMLGRIEYAGDPTPFLPFLTLGEIVGVGNNCAFGLGRYKLLI